MGYIYPAATARAEFLVMLAPTGIKLIFSQICCVAIVQSSRKKQKIRQTEAA